MNQIQSRILSVLLMILLTLALSSESTAVHICKKWEAKIVSVQGSVEVKRTGKTQWEPVAFNNAFCMGDMLRILDHGRAAIVLSNDTILRLDQNTTITFTGAEKDQTSFMEVLKGVVHFFSRTPQTLKIITPFVNASVEGTEFLVNVYDDKTVVTVFEGQVKTTNRSGSLTLTSGQSAITGKGQAPSFRITVHPRDEVQWALYYLPILQYSPDEFSVIPETDWQLKVQSSIRSYNKGDLRGAFSTIKDLQDVPDHNFFNYRASLLLSVGRVDKALSDIERSLSMAPENSHALSLQSIIAVVQNENERALSLAEKAIRSEPDSAVARIALSYSQQAGSELKNALTSLREAVNLDPENSLVWARLAELRLSFGKLKKALEAANKAVELRPDLSRTQTVLGFAYLTQINIQRSITSFERAIELDQASPLPRLGLGLAKIRKGELKEGRREIEIAASLDPNNALIRSYLGKSFYEEKRDNKAAKQYDIAKELDPLDPTSFFYSAIQKQTLNKPVDALHDLQRSIKLNENRSVYRSRLLLDEDLAARSASLARIYSNLGFQQLALIEGWRSINIDPGNYSAHRFLADSYSVLPRHEIARVSELLQSQLLQPVNLTPVQPKLAESSLFFSSNTGPGELSFNEFNPLFDRNNVAMQISGIGGENETVGSELTVSTLQNNVAISLGQYNYQTDGFRKNNDLDHNIYNIFTQASLSYRTSIMAEFRIREFENGDLTLNFDPDDYLPEKREKDESMSVRLGLRHSFTSHSEMIATFIYIDSEASLHDVIETLLPPTFTVIETDFDIEAEENSHLTEIQHLFRTQRFNVVSGAGHLETDINEATTIGPSPPDVEETDTSHDNLYLYSHINFSKNLTVILGSSADFFDGEFVNRDQFNPKLGLTYDPLPDYTVRAAAFRVLKRSLISSQTLEPTQVAGFNQFFDDAAGTRSWRYGIAMDKKFSAYAFGGLEYSRRYMDVPFEDIPASPFEFSEVKEAEWKEQLSRVYLYWTPHSWLALSTGYSYERFDRDREFAAGIEQVKTHIFPIGISFYHPSGLSSRLNATYRDQEGIFQPQNVEDPDIFFPGSDRFWIVDFSMSYRLSKRSGLIMIGAKNIFDKSFDFQDTDPVSPVIQPERMIFGKFTLAL